MLLRFVIQILCVLVSGAALAADPVPVTVQRLGDVLIDKELRGLARQTDLAVLEANLQEQEVFIRIRKAVIHWLERSRV